MRGPVTMAKTNPLQFIQQVRGEVAKVVWPTRREVVLTTIMVFIMAALTSVFFFIVDLIIRTTEEYHAQRHSTEAELVDYMSRLRRFHEENRRADIERRQKSHRAA